MSDEDLKFAIDDARCRHQALVSLILYTDQKAMAVFRLYVTIGIAAAAAAVAGFFESDAILVFAKWSLTAAALSLALGAYFCFLAMTRAFINLPGRGADFWNWAVQHQIPLQQAASAYLKELETKQAANRSLNENTASHLDTAVKLGIATPVIAAVVGLLALAIGHLDPLGSGSSGYPSQLEEEEDRHHDPEAPLDSSAPSPSIDPSPDSEELPEE